MTTSDYLGGQQHCGEHGTASAVRKVSLGSVSMDLKSIINTESTNNAPPRQASVQETPGSQNFQYQAQQNHLREYDAATYQGARHDIRPPQPPPLQHPPHHDIRSPTRSMSHQSIQSPYANTPTSSLNGNQYPFPHPSTQSTASGTQGGPVYTQRDRTTTIIAPGPQAYGQPSPALLTPTATTPGSSYGYTQPQRPQSSHSSMTPTSAQSHIQNFPRDSPHGNHTNMSAQGPRYSGQQYQSQPGTPLGPPPIIGRPSPSLHREGSLPYSYDHHRSQSGSSYINTQGTVPSPIAEAHGPLASSPVAYNPRQTPARSRSYLTDEERERSLSVSPKTRLPSQTKQELFEVTTGHDHSRRWSEQVTSARRTGIESISEENLPHASIQQKNHHSVRPDNGSMNSLFTSTSVDERDSRTRDYASNPTQSHPIHSQAQMQSPSLTLSISQAQPLNYQTQTYQSQNSPDINNTSPTILHSSTFPTQYTTAAELYTSHTIPSLGSSSVTPQRQLPSTPQQVQSNRRTPPSQTSPTPPSTSHLNPSFPPPMSVQAIQSSSAGIQSTGMQSTDSLSTVNSVQQVHSVRHTQTSLTPPLNSHANSNFPPPISAQAVQPFNAGPSANTTAAAIIASDQASRKRKRYAEPPIYAQKARGGNPLLPNKRLAMNRLTPVKQESVDTKVQIPTVVPPKLVKEESNGHAPPVVDMPVPKAQPEFKNDGPLGPWEPSILAILPAEELTRVVADFLFAEVVIRDDVAASTAGAGPGRGTVLEIEAKLGQFIDRGTDSRLRLPVMTECVLIKNDPSLRVAFKSAMTEAQHRSLNGFLNEALKASLNYKKPNPTSSSPPPKPRIQMSYVHTRERDTFYELSQAGELALPPFVRAQLNPRHNRPKVRITTDQKTGKELARIIKVRVSDLDVYSPKTPFDWRISVNLEMAFEGDMRELVEVQDGQRKQPDRNKDRMTYKHLAYQIDLTQVTPAEATSQAEKEHELEVEVSAAEIRKQGILLRTGQANQYSDVIQGFVDNVRILARHCQ